MIFSQNWPCGIFFYLYFKSISVWLFDNGNNIQTKGNPPIKEPLVHWKVNGLLLNQDILHSIDLLSGIYSYLPIALESRSWPWHWSSSDHDPSHFRLETQFPSSPLIGIVPGSKRWDWLQPWSDKVTGWRHKSDVRAWMWPTIWLARSCNTQFQFVNLMGINWPIKELIATISKN